jgi:hypothetical protein
MHFPTLTWHRRPETGCAAALRAKEIDDALAAQQQTG